MYFVSRSVQSKKDTRGAARFQDENTLMPYGVCQIRIAHEFESPIGWTVGLPQAIKQ